MRPAHSRARTHPKDIGLQRISQGARRLIEVGARPDFQSGHSASEIAGINQTADHSNHERAAKAHLEHEVGCSVRRF